MRDERNKRTRQASMHETPDVETHSITDTAILIHVTVEE